MTTSNLGELVNKLYALLEPLDVETRVKSIRAVQILFGDKPVEVPVAEQSFQENGTPHSALDSADNAVHFFDKKQPKAKIEELAVAVRFLELTHKNESITKSDIEDVIVAARRNFDSGNFNRDMDNARAKGLFNKSRDKGVFILSHYGQKYVDTLPDRESTSQIPRPTGARKRKSNAVKAAKNKA